MKEVIFNHIGFNVEEADVAVRAYTEAIRQAKALMSVVPVLAYGRMKTGMELALNTMIACMEDRILLLNVAAEHPEGWEDPEELDTEADHSLPWDEDSWD